MSTANRTSINDFINAIAAKVGTAKTAAATNEPDNIGGATTHPIKKVDDNTQGASTGARAAENSADVKKDIVASVDTVAPAKAGTAKADQPQIGTKQAPTGEEPSVETASVTSGTKDVKTSHPATTNNDALNGGKYAGDYTAADLPQLLAKMAQDGNALCASITAHLTQQPAAQPKVAAAPVAPAAPAAQPKQVAASDAVYNELARQVGWDVAAILSQRFDKRAADAAVRQDIALTIKEAEEDADNVIAYMHNYVQTKEAQEARAVQTARQAVRAKIANMGGMGGGMPAGAPGGGSPEEAAAMEAALGGGAGGEGGGGDDAAAMDQVIQELSQKLGMPPEQVLELLEAEAAGSEGGEGGVAGAGGELAGGAGGGAATAPPGMAVQAADQATKAASLQFIREIVERSRQKAGAAARA